MNYKNRIYDTVTAYMAKLSEFDTLERELEAQERAETISRVHAAERREEWEQQRKADFDAYAASATNSCRDTHSIRTGMFLENIGVPATCSIEY